MLKESRISNIYEHKAEPWSKNFSYDYYRKLIQAAIKQRTVFTFSQAETALKTPGAKIFIRHDVDVDSEKAVDMAALEAAKGIKSTYFAITNTPMYSLGDSKTSKSLKKIINMGHEVGLHFNPSKKQRVENNLDALDVDMQKQAESLSRVTGQPVHSVSFHMPPNELWLKGPLRVNGFINAYSSDLIAQEEGALYLSDSMGRWRDGDPLPSVLNNTREKIQLLTHPIWWNKQHKEPIESIKQYYQTALSTGKSDQVEELKQIFPQLATAQTLWIPGFQGRSAPRAAEGLENG